MAISTVHTYLVSFPDTVTAVPTASDISKATKVIDITSFPDLGGDPDKIDVTTLSDENQVNINGLKKLDQFKFEANYELADHKKLATLEGKHVYYGVFFGADSTGKPDAHNGAFVWKGELTSYPKSGKANEAISDQIVISCESKLSFIYPASA